MIKLSILVAIISVVMYYFLLPLLYPLMLSDHITGKRIIVTGASQGVGASLAMKYAEYGASDVVIVSRSLQKLLQGKDLSISLEEILSSRRVNL